MVDRRWLRAFGTPLGLTAAVLMGVVLTLALVAPIVWGEQASTVDTSQMLAGPSPEHWAGTDNLGRDILARVLVATRLSVVLALSATAVAVSVGLLLGSGPMLVGRRLAGLLTGAVNVAVAFPGLLLALFFAVIFGVGAKGAVLAIGLAGAPAFARLCQTLIAGIGERDFIVAARIAGVGRSRILVRHVLPNIGEPLVVNATIGAGGALLAFAGLSFLGLGVQAPDYDWGRLLQDGLTGIYVQPMGAVAPGLAIVVAGLAFNLFGETIAKGFGVGVADAGMPRTVATTPAAALAPAPPAQEGLGADAGGSVGGRREAVLDVQDLTVTFPVRQGRVRPVRSLTFRVEPSEAVGIVGESGSGKSLTALAVAQLIEAPGIVTRHAPAPAGHGPAPRRRPGAPPLPGHLAVHGVPGSGDLVQPHPPGRRPAGRGRSLPPGHEPRRGTRTRHRPPPCRPCAGARTARRPVPARVLGWHASAGHDRHGRHGPPGPHHRGRAHHRPGRHHPEAGAPGCCSRSARPMASPSCSSAMTWRSSASSATGCW